MPAAMPSHSAPSPSENDLVDYDKVMTVNTSWIARMRLALACTVAVVVLALAPNRVHAQPTTQRANNYDRYCLPCHGVAGDGLGPAAAWVWPRPRDFTKASYKWRASANPLPSDDDLALTIRFGAKGTSMHGFADALSDADIAAIIAQLKRFAPTAAWSSANAAPLALGTAPAKPGPSNGANERTLGAGPAQLWIDKGCASCHGDDGRGAATAGATNSLKPYDLTTTLLRRPRRGDTRNDRLQAVALTIATGLNGTAMPAFGSALSNDELWALADFVVTLNRNADRNQAAAASVPRQAQHAQDTAAKQAQRAGDWPGAANDPDGQLFGGNISVQGPPPSALVPAAASLVPEQCARCHAAQFRQWSGSIHARAGSPGLFAQIEPVAHASKDFVESCTRCHTPLAEQRRQVDGKNNPTFDGELQQQGIACAGCHVRQWRRFGPMAVASSLLPMPNYPLTTLPIYERSDFCLPCHQLPPALSVANRPLLNTYKEWLEGPYMARGVQCQHCHMPNREHTFLGVHDAATFRQAMRLDATAQRQTDGSVDIRVEVHNIGAGHYLPTTPTPAAWIDIELRDRNGKQIVGTHKRVRIGRHIEFGSSGWRDIEDTRIPPGGKHTVATGWRDGMTAQAATMHIQIEVHPDDYYEGLYQTELRKSLPAAQRAMYQLALQRAQASYYVALQRNVDVGVTLLH